MKGNTVIRGKGNHTYSMFVPKARMQSAIAIRKQGPQILKTLDLELIGLLLDDLPGEGGRKW